MDTRANCCKGWSIGRCMVGPAQAEANGVTNAAVHAQGLSDGTRMEQCHNNRCKKEPWASSASAKTPHWEYDGILFPSVSWAVGTQSRGHHEARAARPPGSAVQTCHGRMNAASQSDATSSDATLRKDLRAGRVG